jgi:hypothetical protein
MSSSASGVIVQEARHGARSRGAPLGPRHALRCRHGLRTAASMGAAFAGAWCPARAQAPHQPQFAAGVAGDAREHGLLDM